MLLINFFLIFYFVDSFCISKIIVGLDNNGSIIFSRVLFTTIFLQEKKRVVLKKEIYFILT